ncbi:DUF7224 domain-containing protein [Actinomadura roseirufa]|uniref:DUF7224 domain-containing protein n=1 Tax=Actinomadura roseirufa TaxID=2094049 RepID=UPI00104114C7|nr:hypothetical protein [Actinomadura roseirufa]
MPLHRWLRSAAALYALPVMGVYLYLLLSGELQNIADNWRDATVVATSSGVMALGPTCAAVGAWEGARLRRGGVLDGTPVRRPAAVLLWSALPIGAAAVAVLAFAFALVTPEVGGIPGAPDPPVVAVGLLVIGAWSLAGVAAGRFLHPAIGVPLLLIGTWLWLAYPQALEPLWIRHLTGENLGTCCSTDTVLDRRVLWAQALVAAAVAVVAYLVWSRGFRPIAVKAAVVAVPAAALVVAVSLVDGLGADSDRPRTGGLECVREQGVEVCVWRERRARLGYAARLVVPASRRLAVAIGMPAPRRITEGAARDRESWHFTVAPQAGDDDVVFALATGFLPPASPPCAKDREFDGDAAYVPVGTWLAIKAGLPRAVVAAKTGPMENGDAVTRVLARPRADQIRWFRRNLAALRSCDIRPVDVE